MCATGLEGSNADDVAKEVAIYRFHKAIPIVITTEGNQRFGAAMQALTVPAVPPQLAFVLCTMVGHLSRYEAALATSTRPAAAAGPGGHRASGLGSGPRPTVTACWPASASTSSPIAPPSSTGSAAARQRQH